MGLIRHHAIIVTSWHRDTIGEAHQVAINMFGKLVTSIMTSVANEYYTFFIGPDGSKEGWCISEEYDELRDRFMDDMKTRDLHAAEVQYYSETGVTWIREEHEPRPGDEAR